MLTQLIIKISKNANRKINVLLMDLDLITLCNNLYVYANIDIISKSIFQTRSIKSHYHCNPVIYNKNKKYDLIISDKYQQLFLDNNNFQYLCLLNRIPIQTTKLKFISSNKGFLYKNINYIINFMPNISEQDKKQQKITQIIQKSQPIVKQVKSVQKEDYFQINLQQTPILIRSKDRLNYLVYMLNSLLQTKLYSSKITIVDDCSKDKNLNDFLFSNKKIQLQQIDFYQNIKDINTWNKYLGIMPHLPKHVNGIKNKINVYQFDKSYGDCKGLLQTIKYGFQSNKNAKIIIVLQDDIVLNKDWLSKVYQLYMKYRKQKIGSIPLFHNKLFQKQHFFDLQILGPAVCYTRQFYNCLLQNGIFQKQYIQCQLTQNQRSRKSFIQLQKYNISGDTHIAYYAKKYGFKNVFYKNSMVQHIGVQSKANAGLSQRITKNFIGKFQYNKNAIQNIKNYNNKRILIFSNINFQQQKKQLLNIKQDDLLVFLNTSVPIKYFKQHKNKIIFYRFGTQQYFGQKQTGNINCKKYALDGPNDTISLNEYNQIIKQYSQTFMNSEFVKKRNSIKPYHRFRQGPTSGWLAQFLMKYRYPNSKIQLVNFFPTQDNSTAHFTGHDWKFEKQYYKNSDIKVYDLRTSFECVYLTDDNPKYLQLCKKSIDTLLKFNPNAKVTIVSPYPLQVEYNNIVLQDLNNKVLKQNKNDRITKTTYLKLLFTKLPFDRCMFIDPDTIIKGNLYNIFIADIPYLGCTQSHNYGNIQAKQLNHQKYFLAGFMVMNLKNLRKINFYDKVMKLYSNMEKYKNVKIWQHQQTILNIQFYDLITELHRKYNYCYNRPYTNKLNDNQVIVYHFPGENKQAMNIVYNKVMNNGK